jgi:catechol 2,3-dioxygenase-like lactoylglutathione lyase family enzyme
MRLTPAVIELVVTDMPTTLAFYRRLGLDLPEDAADQGHVETTVGTLRLAFDTREVVRSFDPNWSPPEGGHRVALAFEAASPADVDAAYDELTAAGAHGHLPPFDAPWGMRYAVIHDPDGTPVDLFAASAEPADS